LLCLHGLGSLREFLLGFLFLLGGKFVLVGLLVGFVEKEKLFPEELGASVFEQGYLLWLQLVL